MTVKSITLKLIGEPTMHCGGCARSIQYAIRRVPGVRQVEADHKTQQIDLTFDAERMNLELVRQKLDWVGGYQVAKIKEA